MLSNEKYTGKVEVFKSSSSKLIDSTAPYRRHKNHGEFARHVMMEPHPAIISQEVFDAVQLEKARRTNISHSEGGATRSNTRYSAKRDAEKLVSAIRASDNQAKTN